MLSNSFYNRTSILVLSLLCGLFLLGGCGTKEAKQREVVVEEIPVQQEVVNDTSVEIGETFFLPILAYHHVGPAPATASESVKTWYVSADKFEKDLQYLQQQGYTTLFAKELAQALETGKLPEKAILITFDDGPADYYDYAIDILNKYDMKSTMFLQSHVRSKNWLSEQQIQELDDTGLVEFGSHTKYHAYLTRVSKQEAMDELVGSKEKIEKLLGKEVVSLGYPYGLYNEEVKQWVEEAGYQVAFTIDGGFEQTKIEPFELNRIIVTEITNLENVLP